MTRELTKFYTNNESITMIVLGGSPSRNLSDEYSDLDIVVYWDKIDYEWLEKVPLSQTNGNRIYFNLNSMSSF